METAHISMIYKFKCISKVEVEATDSQMTVNYVRERREERKEDDKNAKVKEKDEEQVEKKEQENKR